MRKIEKIPRGIRGEKSSTNVRQGEFLESNLINWSTSKSQKEDGTRCLEG